MITAFTPLQALAGGALIGLAATLLYAGIGRIAGISGILNSSLEQSQERGWRIAFLLGLAMSAGIVLAVRDAGVREGFPPGALLVAGLLVGFGTRLGNGCTSGHGICGLSRMSKRSLAAVAVFMASGMACVYLLRHALEWPP